MTPPLTPGETLGSFLAWLILIPVIFGFVFKAPKLVVFGFLAVLFMFSDSTWGELRADGTIYSRGVGIFYFSLLNLVLLVAGAGTLIKQLANPYGPRLAPEMSKYLVAFAFLLFGNLVLGIMQGIDIDVILGPNGILNVLNMLIFMYLVIMAFRSDQDTRKLLLAILILATIRGVFGVIRYVWLGGDPANPYRNFDGMDIKILFFDISDNFVASLAAFCSAWLLGSPDRRLTVLNRLCLWSILGLEIAAVALSYRRSSLLGLAFMFGLLLYRLPGKRKIQFGLIAIAALAVITVIFFDNRLQFASRGKDLMDSLMFDVSPNKGIGDSRFYELYAAAQSIGSDWLFGLGTWGTFVGDPERLSYHEGNYGFVHSGFGHMVLKSGIVGLVMFTLLLGAYVTYYFRHRKWLTGNARLLADAGFAGFLFWIPTLLIGTPIIEFRTMLLIGLSLALPFVAVGLQTYNNYNAATIRSEHAAA